MHMTRTSVNKKAFSPSVFFHKVAEECTRVGDVVFPEGFEAVGPDGSVVSYLKVDNLPSEFNHE